MLFFIEKISSQLVFAEEKKSAICLQFEELMFYDSVLRTATSNTKLEPSREDRLVTERLIRAGSILGINLIDHIITGDNGFYSFREEWLKYRKLTCLITNTV